MSEQSESIRLRIRREAGGLLTRLREHRAGQWFAANWQTSKRFRIAGYALAGLIVLYLLLWVTVLRALPSADRLLSYQPPLPTMVRGVNGEIVYSYARERRVQLRFVDLPNR